MDSFKNDEIEEIIEEETVEETTTDPTDETLKGYKQDYKDFLKEKTLLDSLKESYRDFSEWIGKKFS